MKFIHIGDLHTGKTVNGFSMLEDQKYIFDEILKITDEERPDGVLIAGDVYDKASPSSSAVSLFDEFLFRLSQKGPEIFIISGNHDSPERLSFGGRIMDKSGIHIAPVYDAKAAHVRLYDEYGPVNVYMLPFIRPKEVRPLFADAVINDYTDAVRCAVSAMNVDESERNILLAHQFVTGAVTYKSEELNIGGLDNVDSDVFGVFDYTALGHVHGPQNVGSERIRYCGTPLKYSFSECSHKKSVTVLKLYGKGNISVETRPLKPLHDMMEIRGKYEEITLREFYKDSLLKSSYLHITLTDEEDIPEALGRLKAIYPLLMKLDYDNTRTKSAGTADKGPGEETKSPARIFADLYRIQNNADMSDDQKEILDKLTEDIWESVPKEA